MLAILNTKLLIAILAAITIIGSIVIYDSHKSALAAEAVQKQHQEQVDYENKVKADFEKARKHNTNPANESGVWDKYVP